MALFESYVVEGMTIFTRTLVERNAQGEFLVKEALSPEELVNWVKAQMETGEYDPRFWDLTPLQVAGQTIQVRRDYDEEDGEYITITHGYESIHTPQGKEVLSGCTAETSIIYVEALAN